MSPDRARRATGGRVAHLPAALDRLHERLFVAGYAAIQRRSEAAGMAAIRAELVGRAEGRVLEIGAGTGLNLPHYGAAVRDLTLVEPAVEMRRALWEAVLDLRRPSAREAVDTRRVPGHAAAGAGPTVQILDGVAEALPVADGAVDVVVGTFVLCSVGDPAAVLREVARVLRPGGRFLALEHVLGEHPARAAVQHAVAPAWRFAVRGCRPDQDVEALIEASPLRLESVVPFRGPRQPWPVATGARIEARRD